MKTKRKRKRGGFLILLGLLLISSAFVLTGYNIKTDYDAGVAVQTLMEELGIVPKRMAIRPENIEQVYFNAEDGTSPSYKGPSVVEIPDYILNPNMEMPVVEQDGYDYIGVLSIPTLGLDLPVMSEWSYPGLKIAPGRFTGSVYLDNLIICAHNYDTHFGQLKNLPMGSLIRFTDVDGNVFEYKTVEIIILDPQDDKEMQAGEWDLTLFTCTIGGATRVTLRCERV